MAGSTLSIALAHLAQADSVAVGQLTNASPRAVGFSHQLEASATGGSSIAISTRG